MQKLSERQHAAIAQLVERILGKDEVSSSNLDSSSIETSESKDSGVFSIIECKTGDLIRSCPLGGQVF